MTDLPPQPIPPFEVPENPLLKLPTENPRERTRPVIRPHRRWSRLATDAPDYRGERDRPQPLGALMPAAAVEMRRRQLDREASDNATLSGES